MKTTKAILIAAIGVGLTLSAGAQPGKHSGEKVDVKSLPAEVQQTIKEKAAGGNVIKVMREDDPDGKWNYEVFVKTNGKESGFEIDPNGKFLKEHGE
jgi:uncharacterized membrane protein YkoI